MEDSPKPLLVPEVILYNVINALLGELKDNYNNTTEKTKTHLYRFWNGVKDTKYDYYKEAVHLFAGREKDNPRKVEARMFFDAERAKIPTIHITMPSDQTGENSIGMDQSGRVDEMYIDNVASTITPTLGRRFNAQFYIVCTSDNNREVLLMYHTLRAMLISSWRSLELAGLSNIKLSGQELKIDDRLVPNHIFMRGIGVLNSYDVRVPEVFPQPLINQIILNPGTIVTEDSNNTETE